jgi:fatty-acyl-CoA synthase
MTPDKPALRRAGRTRTYAELDHRAARLATGLRARGVRRGDRVAFLGLNSIELVETMFAVAKLGAVFLPVNTRLAPPELRYVLANSGARMLMWESGFEAGGESDDVASLGIDRHRVDTDDDAGIEKLLGPEEVVDEPVGPDDLFMIQYTSGTSGRPKGVMLSHGNVIWNVVNLLVDIDLGSDEVALVTAPLFHTAALNQVLLPTLLKGGTAVIEAKFDPERAIELIETERVTLLFGVTSMYLALSATSRFADADLGSLRSALSGGAPIPESLLESWLERGQMITQGYGLTEASPGATMLRAADGVRKLGSAGTACFFSDVKVVTPEGEPTVAGEQGEVLVQGPNVSSGYWEDPAATDQAFADGWLRTGDVAVVDAEGYLTIVDRLKDMFISGGENVYPAEVERAVYSHPAVAECAVIGVPDAQWGEVGCAFVVTGPDAVVSESELITHLEGRLARYKIPRTVVLVPELPHNASGKLVKSLVRELLA